MRIPDVTRIMGVDVPTEWVDVLCTEDGRVAQGIAQYVDNKIQLGRHMPVEQREHTYFHEVMHHVANSLGVEVDEDDVLRLSRGLWAVLVDNGLLKEA